MKIEAIKCLKCNTVIYSRSIHDFKRCDCGETFIDGGFDNMRYGGDIKFIKFVEINVDTTK